VRLRVAAAAGGPQRSPGLLTRHYSPRAPLTLYEGPVERVIDRIRTDVEAAEAAGRRVGLLVPDDDAAVTAARLYAALRAFDAEGVDEIFARLPQTTDGLSQAIADRLRRAAAGRVVSCA
jgi:L-threonylcarbamoyladenylate synthase